MDLGNHLKATIRTVPDFPIDGIQFRDITPVLSDPVLMGKIIDSFEEHAREHAPTCVAGPEARGFIFGPLLAMRLNVPFVPIRKPGKLPHKTVSVSYSLEYGTNELQMHEDALGPGDRAILVDDLLATGGTVEAAASLISKAGAETVAALFLIELVGLEGRARLGSIPTRSLVELPA